MRYLLSLAALGMTVGLTLAGCAADSGDMMPDTMQPDPGDPGDPGDPDGPVDPGSIDITGAVQKGPFGIGSNVLVSVIDPETTLPTGPVFPVTTRNSLGEFKLTLPAAKAIEILTMGFYFNEISGDSSGAQISMRAVAAFDGSGSHSVIVNALTHLTSLRVKKLVSEDELSFAEAIAQAEDELRSQLPLAASPDIAVGTELDLLGGDSADNAYLFALSCILTLDAALAGVASVDAALQERLNTIALDLEDDGALDVATRDDLATAARFLDGELCMANMAAFLDDQDAGIEVPNIYRAIDFDSDGVADAVDDDADGDGLAGTSDLVVGIADSFSPGTGLALDANGTTWIWSQISHGPDAPNGCTVPTGCRPLPRPDQAPARQLAAYFVGLTEAFYSLRHDDGTVSITSFSGTRTISGVNDATWIGVPSRSSSGRGASLFLVREDDTAWTVSNLSDPEITAEQVANVSDVREFINVRRGVNDLNDFWVLHTDGTITGHDGDDTTTTYTITGLPAIATFEVTRDTGRAIDESGGLWRWSALDAIATGTAAATQITTPGPVASLRPEALDHVALRDGTVWKVDGVDPPVQVSGLSDVRILGSSHAVLDDGSTLSYDIIGPESATARTTPLYIPR